MLVHHKYSLGLKVPVVSTGSLPSDPVDLSLRDVLNFISHEPKYITSARRLCHGPNVRIHVSGEGIGEVSKSIQIDLVFFILEEIEHWVRCIWSFIKESTEYKSISETHFILSLRNRVVDLHLDICSCAIHQMLCRDMEFYFKCCSTCLLIRCEWKRHEQISEISFIG